MEDVCTEYARNFSALELRYAETQQRLKMATERGDKLEEQLLAVRSQLEGREGQLRQATADLAAAQQYKERLANANIAIEHMKGRVETARKALQDKDQEHAYEMEQLKGQLGDALSRVASVADVPLLNAVKTQKAEVEERCALVAGQLLEEKERAGQQQLTAVAAVRDLSSRQLELEQRCRALDAELTSQRGTARRAVEQQQEAVLERDRAALELQAQASLVGSLRQEVLNASRRLEEQADAHEAQQAEARLRQEQELDALRRRADDASARAALLAGDRATEAERLAAAQRATQTKVEAARDEVRGELEAAAAGRAAALEEQQRLKQRLAEARRSLEEAQAEARRHQQAAQQASDRQRGGALQLDTLQQQLAFAESERDRSQALLERAQQRAEEVAIAAREGDAARLEVERLKLQLEHSRRDVDEQQQLRQREAAAVDRLEAAHDAKLAAAVQQTRHLRREHRQRLQKENRQKRALLKALLESEKARGTAAPVPVTGAPVVPAPGGSFDPLALLKAQGDAARQFQERLQELQEPSAISAGVPADISLAAPL